MYIPIPLHAAAVAVASVENVESVVASVTTPTVCEIALPGLGVFPSNSQSHSPLSNAHTVEYRSALERLEAVATSLQHELTRYNTFGKPVCKYLDHNWYNYHICTMCLSMMPRPTPRFGLKQSSPEAVKFFLRQQQKLLVDAGVGGASPEPLPLRRSCQQAASLLAASSVADALTHGSLSCALSESLQIWELTWCIYMIDGFKL